MVQGHLRAGPGPSYEYDRHHLGRWGGREGQRQNAEGHLEDREGYFDGQPGRGRTPEGLRRRGEGRQAELAHVGAAEQVGIDRSDGDVGRPRKVLLSAAPSCKKPRWKGRQTVV